MDLILKPLLNCNLRCIYCIETPNHGLQSRMCVSDVARMIGNLQDYYDHLDPKEESLTFTWQGGEPLLLGTDFFYKVIALQEQAFGGRRPWKNQLQTNLLLLDEGWIELFKREGDRLSVGVSFDFYGNDRRKPDGSPSRRIVLMNIHRMMNAGLRPGILCMLTRANIGRLQDIYRFIHHYPLPVRFNQLMGAPDLRGRRRGCGGPSRLTNAEYTGALRWLNKTWIEDQTAAGVVINARQMMRQILYGSSVCSYSRDCQAGFMTVLPDGSAYPCDDFYLEEFRLGNILTDPFERILDSPVRKAWRKRQWHIHNRACRDCDVVQYCNGGCPNHALAFGRGLYGRDPFCSMHRSLFRQLKTILASAGYLDDAKHARLRERT